MRRFFVMGLVLSACSLGDTSGLTGGVGSDGAPAPVGSEAAPPDDGEVVDARKEADAPAVDARVADAKGIPDSSGDSPTDAPAAVLRPRTIAITSGGGVAKSSRHRVAVSVGAPAAYGTMKGTNHDVRLGVSL